MIIECENCGMRSEDLRDFPTEDIPRDETGELLVLDFGEFRMLRGKILCLKCYTTLDVSLEERIERLEADIASLKEMS